MEKLSFEKYWEFTELSTDFQGLLTIMHSNIRDEYSCPIKLVIKNYSFDVLETVERLDIISAAIQEIFNEVKAEEIPQTKKEEYTRLYNSIKCNALPYELAYL